MNWEVRKIKTPSGLHGAISNGDNTICVTPQYWQAKAAVDALNLTDKWPLAEICKILPAVDSAITDLLFDVYKYKHGLTDDQMWALLDTEDGGDKVWKRSKPLQKLYDLVNGFESI